MPRPRCWCSCRRCCGLTCSWLSTGERAVANLQALPVCRDLHRHGPAPLQPSLDSMNNNTQACSSIHQPWCTTSTATAIATATACSCPGAHVQLHGALPEAPLPPPRLAPRAPA
jgi:hypothetical protein